MPEWRPRHHLRRLALLAGLVRLAGDERGSLVPLMALAVVPLVGLLGLAVDATRFYNSRAALQSAVDNAALAGAGAFGRGDGAMLRLTRAYLDRAAAEAPGTRIGEPRITIDGSRVQVAVEASVLTLFMRVLGPDEVTVAVRSAAVSQPRGVEVALVLDVTGSMHVNSSGGVTRLVAMRQAAADLVNILFDNAAGPELVRIALVPYNAAVNIGTGMGRYVTKRDAARFPGTSWAGCVMERASGHDVKDTYTPGATNGSGEWAAYRWPVEPNRVAARGSAAGQCVNRGGPDGRHLNVIDQVTERAFPQNTRGPNMACPQPILPLTSDRGVITDRIAALEAVFYGGTITSTGVGWGWRVLSPRAPFQEGAAYDDEGWDKYLIVLTDGEQILVRQDPCNGNSGLNDGAWSYNPADYGSWGTSLTTGPKTDWTAYGYLEDSRTLSSSANYVPQLESRLRSSCTNAKAERRPNGQPAITVYSVSFGDDLPAAIRTLVRGCATSTERYFHAPTRAALDEAFRRIAFDILSARLTE